MKIEELYPQNEADKKEKKTVEKPAATSVAKNVSASSEEKKSKDPCKIKSKRVASSKRKRQHSAPKFRSTSSRMKLEQVNRHEEHSYLLEAETNQAILENVVYKDEICRYLSPLKFIEIDSWRRDVPYGLKTDSDEERRKWRSPMEILYAGGLFKGADSGEKDNSTTTTKEKNQIIFLGSNTKLKRRLLVRNSDKKELNEKETNLATKDQIEEQDCDANKEAGASAYKTRGVWQRRPATSPDRKVILNKVKSERILSRNQTSAAVVSGIRNKTITSHDALPLSGGLYNRPSLSSAISLRRTASFNNSLKQRSIFQETYGNSLESSVLKTQKMEFTRYRQLIGNPSNDSTTDMASQSLFPSVRPRTRVRTSRSRAALGTQHTAKVKTSTTTGKGRLNESFEQHRTEPPNKLSDFHSDPNIAYIPQSYRVSDSSRDNGSHPSATAVAEKAFKTFYSADADQEQDSAATAKPNNKTVAVLEETVRLPRDSLFSSTSSPRVDSTTPRTYKSSNLPTNRSWTSKLTSSSFQSPWVTQALPDFSKRDYASKAEMEGYYVRKPGKTVSFRVNENDLEKRKPRGYDVTASKKNISMVVVNVDEPSQNILPHSGATKLTQNANSFAGANAISVRQ